MLYIYNTLTKQKQLFKSIQPNMVKMYVCGMTVYDDCHLGHARVMVVFDMVRDWLETMGYTVIYVRNITDIDDKIINKAIQTQQRISDITDLYIQHMQEDSFALGVKRPDYEPRATAYVDQMQEMIEALIQNGLAYQKRIKRDTHHHNKHQVDEYLGDVYFAVNQFKDYGRLSGKKLEDLQQGERISQAELAHKDNPLDFVLWKLGKAHEPKEALWDSPWGVGRPGWHIECSAMSCSLLGDEFDIHGGGLDLQFPHHENEIAQTIGATQGMKTQKNWVNYWMHNGFVRVDDEKMSKSLGNFFTIRDILRKYPAEIVRFFILRAHYRSPLNYSDMILDDAKFSLKRLYNTLDEILYDTGIIHDDGVDILSNLELDGIENPRQFTLEALNSIDWSEHYAERFQRAMNDDFNTAQAIHILFEMTSFIHQMKYQDWPNAVRLAFLMRNLGHILGILKQTPKDFLQGTEHDPAWVTAKILERKAAKNQKNWQLADQIRQELLSAKVILKDLPDGTTTWSVE